MGGRSFFSSSCRFCYRAALGCAGLVVVSLLARTCEGKDEISRTDYSPREELGYDISNARSYLDSQSRVCLFSKLEKHNL